MKTSCNNGINGYNSGGSDQKGLTYTKVVLIGVKERNGKYCTGEGHQYVCDILSSYFISQTVKDKPFLIWIVLLAVDTLSQLLFRLVSGCQH